jgi:protein gp37
LRNVQFISAELLLGPPDNLDLDGIDWLIVGRESGLRHRPMREERVLDLCDHSRLEWSEMPSIREPAPA